MPEGGGKDNLAFAGDECTDTSDRSNSTLENSHTESLQNSRDAATVENENQQSFVSQHYVEPIRSSPEPQYKTETRIELPADSLDKNTGAPKLNGVHGHGNNNDASFLNSSATNVQANDGKKEQIEAVNLELVSMRPYTSGNLQTKGQEACEVPADPYEEYFVPVNEHRKYIRGEKLYVTKDKRSSSSYWRRIACWGCGLFVLAIAVIIAILAATGVILTQEATQPLENEDHTSSRQFGNVQASGSQEYMKNPPTSPPPETSSFPPWPTTDESLYRTVPKALDGMIQLDNLQWIEELNDPKSRTYREVTTEIENNLKDMLHVVDNLSVVKVYNVSKDGEVKFRVSYPPTPTPEQTQTSIEKLLQKNGNMIGQYHLRRLSVKRLIDDCEHGNLKCSESCRYDYSEGLFICACFPGRILDKTEKTCKNENDLSNVDMEEVLPEPSTESIQNSVQGRSRGPETAFNSRQSEDWGHKHSEFVTEPSTVPENEPKHVDIQSESPVKSTSEPEPMVESAIDEKTKSELFLEPIPEPESTIESSVEPKAEPEPLPEPSSEPKSEPEPTVESSTEPKLEPESSSEPKSEPESTVESSAEPKVEPESSSEPKSEPEPTVESSTEPKLEPESSSEPKSEPEPTVESSTEPKLEPESSSEPKSEPEPTVESSTEPKLEPESSSEPKSEPESTVESSAEPKLEPESSSEPKSEPEPTVESSTEPKLEPESSSEPKSEPEPTVESSAEPKVEPESSSEPKSEPEPTVESSTEPKLEPESSTEPKSVAEPTVESSAEPKVKSDPKSTPELEFFERPQLTHTYSETTVEPKVEPEPSTEPKFESEFYGHPQWVHEHFEFGTEPNIVLEHDDQSEPNEKPKYESKYSDESKVGSKLHKQSHWNNEHFGFITEHNAVTENNGQPEPSIEPKFEPASSVESKTDHKLSDHSLWDHKHTGLINEPNTVSEDDVLSETSTEPKFESESSTDSSFEYEIPAEPKFKIESKSESELSIGPKFKLESSIESDFERKVITEPNFMTKLNFEPESSTKSKFESESSSEFEFKHENPAEPTFKSESSAESPDEQEDNIELESSTESITEYKSRNFAEPKLRSALSTKPESESESSVEPRSNDAHAKVFGTHNNGVIPTTKPNFEIPEITMKDEEHESVTPLSSIEVTTDEQASSQTLEVPTIELEKPNVQAELSSINYKKHEHEIIPVTSIELTIESKLEADTKAPSSEMEPIVVPSVQPIFESKINDEFERSTKSHVTHGEPSLNFKPQMVPISKSRSVAVTESLNELKLSSMEDTKTEAIPIFVSSIEPSTEAKSELETTNEQKSDLEMTSTLKLDVESTEEPKSELMSSIETEMKVKSSEESDLESDSTTGPQSDSDFAAELKSGSEQNVKVNLEHELTATVLMPESTVDETSPELVSTKEKSKSESTVEPKSSVIQNSGPSSESSNESTAHMPQFELTSESTSELTLLSKKENPNKFIAIIPELKTHVTNESNVIDHMPTTVFPKLPKNIGQNVEPLIEPIKNYTNSEDEHIMVIPNVEHSTEIHGVYGVIPELIPEQSKNRHSTEHISEEPEEKRTRLDVYPAVDNNHSADNFIRVTKTETFVEHTTINSVHSNHPEEFLDHSTNHPLYPMVFPDNPVERSTEKFDVSEEKHTENMSPFLPDVHREKETPKKTPRLDKDEQNVPNPFETHVEDIIMDHPEKEKNETILENDANGTEITGWSNKEHEYHAVHNLNSVTGDESGNRTLKEKNDSIDNNMKPTAFLGLTINDDKDIAENESKTKFNKTPVANETPQHISNADVQLHDSFDISEIINDTESSIHNGLNRDDIQKDDLKQKIDNEKHILNSNNTGSSAISSERGGERMEDIENGDKMPVSEGEGDSKDKKEILEVLPLEMKPESTDPSTIERENPNIEIVDQKVSIKSIDEESIEIPTEHIQITTALPNREKMIKSDEPIMEQFHEKTPEETEENTAEDQYNDITDENVSKGFQYVHNEAESVASTRDDDNASINIDNKTLFQIADDVKKIEVHSEKPFAEHDEVLNLGNVVSNVQTTTRNPLETDTMNSEVIQSVTELTSSNGKPMITTLPEIVTEKHVEDSKLTTQIPVLPIEIQLDVSTMETVEKSETTMAMDVNERQNTMDNLNVVSMDGEKVTTIPTVTTQTSAVESKTIVQVPILPDELQTTENVVSIATSSVVPEIDEASELKSEGSTGNEFNHQNRSEVIPENVNQNELEIVGNKTMEGLIHNETVTTIVNTSAVPSVLGHEIISRIKEHENETISSNDKTMSENKAQTENRIFNVVENSTEILKSENNFENVLIVPPDMLMMHLEKQNLSTTENVSTKTSEIVSETTTVEDIRPVSEIVLDDTKPIEFDYKQLFPTTELIGTSADSDNLSEEELKVIPLEKNQEIKKNSLDKKIFDKHKYKKDKEPNLENREDVRLPIESTGLLTATMLSVEIPKTIMTVNEKHEEIDERNSIVSSSTSRFISADTEGNIVPVSKLKIIEITSGTNQSESIEGQAFTSEKIIPTITSRRKQNENRLIPVFEEIIENEQNVTRASAIVSNDTDQSTDTATVVETKMTNLNSMEKPSVELEAQKNIANLAEVKDSNSENLEERRDVIVNETFKNVSDLMDRSDTVTRATVISMEIKSNAMITEKTDLHQSSAATTMQKTKNTMFETTIQSVEEEGTLQDHIENINSSTGIPLSVPNLIFSKCTTAQFQCLNGTSRDGAYCVSLAVKCDSEDDCSDGSDELNCEQAGCPGNFQCSSGQCLKRYLVCNGIIDCDDGSDEKDCENWKCQFDEFQCPSGRCIPVLWQCDGRPDCEDHRDEYSCAESCGNDEYLCPTEKWCIPQTWHCNGVPECAHGEDEKFCDCALDQFKCQTGGCVPLEQVCDGVEHCPDHSDEWNCLVANLTLDKNLKDGNLSEIQKEDDNGSNGDNELIGRATVLKIRQSNGERRLVCSDGWTHEFSDSYCRALGYFSSEATEMLPQEEGYKFLRLRSNSDPNASLVTNLEQIESCESEKIIEVSCQEFSCGSHYTEGPTARLVGGTPASEGQWSSVALLRELKHGSACTASVLGPMHALASYSCIHRYRQSSGWQLFTGADMLRAHQVKNIVPYPQVKYNQFLYNHDIALIVLAEPLVFSRNVSAVCLPRNSFQPRQLCVTAGWGFPMNGEVNLQQYLKFLPVPTYDSEECNATSHYAGFITKHNICAGFTDTDKGPCYNDEGAPLMCASESGRWEIQGLLSHHSRCSRGHPAIYSSLGPALSWLQHSVPALQAQS